MIIPAIIMLVIDAIYLNLMKSWFDKQLILIQGTPIKMKFIPAIIVYFFLSLILYMFIIKNNRTPLEAFVLGLSVYAVYEFTNYAIIDKWHIKSVIIDTMWGGILFFLTTYLYNTIKK